MKQAKTELATIAGVAQLLGMILIVAALFFARDVFIPLALGLLLSFLLSPLVNRLQRAGIPNVVAVIATALLAFVLLAGGLTMLGSQLTALVGDLPKYKDELVTKARGLAGLTSGMGGSLDQLAEDVTKAIESGDKKPDDEKPVEKEADERSDLARWAERVFPNADKKKTDAVHDGRSPDAPLYIQPVEKNVPIANWASTAETVLGPLATAGLVTVFALFMLIHREDLRDRIISVVSHGNYVTTTEALDEAAHRISRYLIAQTIINTSYGFILAIGLFSIGATMSSDGTFPNAILWGVLATCLRFVPYIGPTAAAVFPLAIAAAVFPGYGVLLVTLAFIVTLELLSNNVMEPWLYGTSTGISAVAVIFAAVFWGWLWGPVGLLLSTPLTVCLVVIGRYVPRFKFLSTLLSDEVPIKPSMRFYHRLLATDLNRAEELLKEYHKENGYDQTCDDILVPTIKRLRDDCDADQLTDEEANTLILKLESLISSEDWRVAAKDKDEDKDQHEEPGDESLSQSPTVFGCISHDASEQLVLRMLDVCPSKTWHLRSIDDEQLPTEIAEEVVQANPSAVVIMVVPKGGFEQARYLCKTIRGAGYRGSLIVACMGKFKNFDKLFVRFRKVGVSNLTTTFAQTRSKIDSVARQSTKAIVANQKTLLNIP